VRRSRFCVLRTDMWEVDAISGGGAMSLSTAFFRSAGARFTSVGCTPTGPSHGADSGRKGARRGQWSAGGQRAWSRNNSCALKRGGDGTWPMEVGSGERQAPSSCSISLARCVWRIVCSVRLGERARSPL
jgi:hypothetical protein